MSDQRLMSDSMDMDQLQTELDQASIYQSLKNVIVNAPFKQPLAVAEMSLAFVVFMQENPATNVIDRLSISETELAQNTFDVTVVPFENIKIPSDCSDNIIVQAINTGQMRDTTDWYYTFTPALTGDQARINQASAGVTYTAIYPLRYGDKRGVLSFSYYKYEHLASDTEHQFMKQYTEMVAKRLSDI